MPATLHLCASVCGTMFWVEYMCIFWDNIDPVFYLCLILWLNLYSWFSILCSGLFGDFALVSYVPKFSRSCTQCIMFLIIFYSWIMDVDVSGFIIFHGVIWILQETTKVRILRYIILFIGKYCNTLLLWSFSLKLYINFFFSKIKMQV